MNFKTTGLLVALLIVVGAVWMFYPKGARDEQGTRTEPQPVDREKPVLDPAPDANSIVGLTIERPGKPRMVFARAPKPDQPDQLDNWRAVEPLAVPVETYMVSGVVSTFTSLRSRVQLDATGKNALSDADAGLAPPEAVLTLADKAGKELKFEVGKKAAMSSDTYVRVAGQKTLHVVARDLSTEVKREFNEYRDKKLCGLSATDAVRLETHVAGRAYVLARGADGAWVIDAPVKAYAQKEEVLNLLRKLSALRAQDFVDDAPATLATFGLDQPYLTVRVTTETKRKVPATQGVTESQPAEPQYETVTQDYGLTIGDFADLKQEQRSVKLAGQPWIARVKQTDVAGLVPDLNKLRDPKVTRVKAADASAIELTVGGATARLAKAGGTWHGSGDLAEIETAAVTDLLEAFEDLSAVDYVLEPGDLATYGLDRPRAVVAVMTGGSVEPVTVRVGSMTKSERNAYVLRDGQPTVFVVSAERAARLAVPPISLRSRSILTTDEPGITRIAVDRGPQHQVLVREAGTWRLEEPAGAPVDRESVRVLANDLSRLRAKRVAGKVGEGPFGLDQPAIVVRFTAFEASAPSSQPSSAPATQAASAPVTDSAPASRPVEHVLRVGRTDAAAYCRLNDEPYVFELDETVYRVLNGEFIDRKLFNFVAGDVIAVTVVAPGGTLELVKEGEEWKYPPDPTVKPVAKKVEDFVKDLAALRVEQYLEYADADLARAGLLTAPLTVSIRLRTGDLVNLKLEQERAGALPRLAGWVEQKRTFRLRPGDCEKLVRGLDYYLKPETKETEKPGGAEDELEPPMPSALPPRPVTP